MDPCPAHAAGTADEPHALFRGSGRQSRPDGPARVMEPSGHLRPAHRTAITQAKHAPLEPNGMISVIPVEETPADGTPTEDPPQPPTR